jgi:hypothetical protein
MSKPMASPGRASAPLRTDRVLVSMHDDDTVTAGDAVELLN